MIDLSTEDLRLMLEAGYLYLAMHRNKEAKEVFEGVCVLAPESDVPLVALGNAFFIEKKYDEAIKLYRNALKKNSKSSFALAYLGESLFFHKKKEEAIQALEEASQIDPHGKSGDFARSLLKLIRKGFDPHSSNEKSK